MKKITLLFSLLFIIFNVQGQKLWKGGQIDITPQNFSQTASDTELANAHKDIFSIENKRVIAKLADCAVDTSLFPLLKANALGLDGLSNSQGRFATVLQRFAVPEGGSVTVNGFDFYAFFSYDTAAPTVISQMLNARVYGTDPGGAPSNYANPLADIQVTVDTSGGTRPSGSIFLADTKYSVTFPTPLVFTDSFFVEVANPDPSIVGIFRNSRSENGQPGSGRGFEDGWLVFNDATGAFLLPATAISANSGAIVWDVDYLLHPHIEFSVDPDFELTDGSCLAHGEASIFENTSSAMTGNPHFNVFAGNSVISGVPDTSWLWVQDFSDQNSSVTIGTRDLVTVYPGPSAQASPGLFVNELGYSRFCEDSIIKTFDSGPLAVASFTASVDTNQTVMFTNNSTGTTFEWDFGDGNTSTDVVPTHTYADGGSYMVTLVASNNNAPCTDTLVQEVNVATTNIQDDLLNTQVNLFPNPSNGVFLLDINLDSPEEVKIEVRNMIGQTVFESPAQRMQAGEIQLNLENQQSGIYLMTLWANDRQITRKLSLNK
ncbi:MAG: PKD domain-containing protein [Bacteroidota bacterium]